MYPKWYVYVALCSRIHQLSAVTKRKLSSAIAVRLRAYLKVYKQASPHPPLSQYVYV